MKPSDGQLAIEGRADRRKIVGAKMRVHREADDRDVPRRLVRLERPVDRRSRVERRVAVSGNPIGLEVLDITAPIQNIERMRPTSQTICRLLGAQSFLAGLEK